MPRDSGGTFTLQGVGNPVITGTVISSSWANLTLSDLATELTDSLNRSGKGAMLAALKLADGTVGSPGLTWGTETGSGWYRQGVATFRFSLGGSDKVEYAAKIHFFAPVTEGVTTASTSGTSHTIDTGLTPAFDLTLGHSPVTLSFTNPAASGRKHEFVLVVRQDGTGSRLITWPASVKWSSGATPVLSTAANRVDVFQFFTLNGGTTWFGAQVMADITP